MANFQCAMFIDILKVLLRIIFMHIIYVLHSVYECMFMNKKPKGFTARSDLLLCQASWLPTQLLLTVPWIPVACFVGYKCCSKTHISSKLNCLQTFWLHCIFVGMKKNMRIDQEPYNSNGLYKVRRSLLSLSPLVLRQKSFKEGAHLCPACRNKAKYVHAWRLRLQLLHTAFASPCFECSYLVFLSPFVGAF